MNSKIYSIYKLIERPPHKEISTLVISYQKDTRALFSIKSLIDKGTKIKNVIILNYPLNLDEELFRNEIGLTIETEFFKVMNDSQDQTKFVGDLRKYKDVLDVDDLCLDISCMKIPQMFLFLKYLKYLRKERQFQVLYTIPFDYAFLGDPFTSYKSYLGDLETTEILGYSGDSEKTREANLVIFIGFEGALSSKIIDDTKYNELILVNGLPAFFPKYKDITVINNYETINQPKKKMHYVPADNPYEVYNFLDEIYLCSEGICIAPLSTKPIALGVCLYALNHPEIRVIYPMSQDIKNEKTFDVHETIIYELSI